MTAPTAQGYLPTDGGGAYSMGMQTTTREVWLEKLAAAWTRWVAVDERQTVRPEDAPAAVQFLAGELAADPELVSMAAMAARFVQLDSEETCGDEAGCYWQCGTDLFGADAWVRACEAVGWELDASIDRAFTNVPPVGELEGDSPTGSVITSTPEEQ